MTDVLRAEFLRALTDDDDPRSPFYADGAPAWTRTYLDDVLRAYDRAVAALHKKGRP